MVERIPRPENPYFDTKEHDRYRRTVIRTIATQEQLRTGEAIPEDVLMVGTDWIYLAKVQNFSEANLSLGMGQPLRITAVGLYGLSVPCPVSKIVDDFYQNVDKLTLIPEGDQRINEARELGDVVNELENSFTVRRCQQEIRVYKIRDANHIVDDKITLPDGKAIGLTDFPSQDK